MTNDRRALWFSLPIALVAWGVLCTPALRAQVTDGEKPLVGAQRIAAKEDLDAFQQEGARLEAKAGKRAAYDALTTGDFVFVFAPADKIETVSRAHFLRKVRKDAGGLMGIGNMVDQTVRPARLASRRGGREIVQYLYPVLTSGEPAPPSSPATRGAPFKPPKPTATTTTFTVQEVFVRTAQGLRLKSMGFFAFAITINGQAVPNSMLSDLTFDRMSGPAEPESDAKPAAPPTVAPAAPSRPSKPLSFSIG